MKFGKLEDISGVDFRLAPDPPGNAVVLRALPVREGPSRAYIGATGWAMKEWVGEIYPPGTKSKDYLREYAKQFNTIELNTTHYRIPDAATIARWRAETSADFRFCPKIPQSISHSSHLSLGESALMQFREAIQGLGEKLGCCFLQLPPYFDIGRLSLLERFFTRWPRELPLAVEMRHASWFEDSRRWAMVVERFVERGVVALITDVAGRRDVAHMALSAPIAMVRFVGNGLHPSDHARIDDWVRRIRRWSELGLREVYFFTHEPDNILAPELAAYLWEQLRGDESISVRGPTLRREDQTGQMSLF
jgi:uncharacterized protein YecE (DUF72 family)